MLASLIKLWAWSSDLSSFKFELFRAFTEVIPKVGSFTALVKKLQVSIYAFWKMLMLRENKQISRYFVQTLPTASEEYTGYANNFLNIAGFQVR